MEKTRYRYGAYYSGSDYRKALMAEHITINIIEDIWLKIKRWWHGVTVKEKHNE